MDQSIWINVAALVVALLAHTAVVVGYLGRQQLRIYEEIARVRLEAHEEASRVRTEAQEEAARVRAETQKADEVVREHLLLKLDGEIAKESKARHDLGQRVQAIAGGFDNDINRMRDRMDSMVHKADLVATETRIMAGLDKLERRLEATP